MKKILLSCLLVALCLGGAFRAWGAPDPGDRFLEAYFLIQEGDAAVHDTDWLKANAKYASALDILNEIKTDSPDWNPHIIEFRSKYINDHLAEVKAKLNLPAPSTQPPSVATTPATPTAPAQATPPPSAPETPPVATAPQEQSPQPTPAPSPNVSAVETNPAPANPAPEAVPAPVVAETPAHPAPPAESDQVKQLRSELERARSQVEQLEAARNDLNTKLQEQLAKVAPTQTTPQIEELMKTNQFLAAQLAAAQTQIEETKERAAAVPVPVPGPSQSEVDALKSQLAQARSELQDTRQQLQDTRLELGTTKQALEKAQADNVELRRSYEQVIGQLTDANRKLTSAKASSDKDDEIIRQLRKENALLRIIAERKASDSITSGAEEENAPGSTSESELRGWHPHARPQTTFKPHPETAKPQTQSTAQPSTMEESSRGKLVATVSAPKKAEQTNETAVAEAPAPQPKPVVASRPPPPPANPKPAPAPKPAPVITPAPPKPAAVLSPADQAKARADAASTTSPNVRTLLNEARAALALKDYTTAASKYDAVLAVEPSNIVALSNLGVIRYQQNRLDDAEKYLRQAAVAAPNDSNTRSLLGVVYFRKGAIEDAYTELNRAVAIDPHNAEAHNYLGIVLSEKGWGASGELEIRRAIEIDPQYPDAHFNLAVIYAKQRNPKVELAKYHYRKALDLGAKPDPELEALLKKLSAQPPAATEDTTKP